MDLSKWNLPIEDKNEVELKRLKIIADMAASVLPELDSFILEKNSDYITGLVSKQQFDNYVRKINNLKKALTFAGYTPDKNGKLSKTCPATDFDSIKLKIISK